MKYNYSASRTEEIISALAKNIITNKLIGWDPYDILNSKYLSFRNNNKVLSVLTQLNRICPTNLRPILKIKKSYNSKANALFLSSFLHLGSYSQHQHEITFLKDWLLENKSYFFDQYSIGFDHDIILKRYSSCQNEPSLIITLFTMYAFIEYYKRTNETDIADTIFSFEYLIENELPKFETKEFIWYSYNFDKINEIYNATAKIGKYYALLYSLRQNDAYLFRIEKILNYLSGKQRSDGSWAYGEEISYTDGFHTAFVLEAIWYMRKLVDKNKYEKMYEKGLDHYKKYLFKNNYQPLYFHPQYKPKDIRRYLIETDIRDCAMAILLFSKTGELDRAEAIIKWTIENMYNPAKGYFYYYKAKFWKSRIEFIRWQAWMLYALSQYLIKNKDIN
jgi:hypothetical protein